MRLLQPPFDVKFNPAIDVMPITAWQMPDYRTEYALQRGVEKNILLKTWGGLGDQICAEPTIRWALKNLKDCKISLHSEHPELFQHLTFERVFDDKLERPNEKNYFVFNTIVDPSNLVWQFFNHMLTNCVDFPSMCCFRMMLPIKDKEVILVPSEQDKQKVAEFGDQIVVHPGKHWPSKTFKKSFWDAVIDRLKKKDVAPIIMGANTEDNRGTVDVDTSGCVDLRNQLSIMESVALLQSSPVLLTNDSSPLHMAVSGDTWIGFIATCKHPDYIQHWRKGQWAWRMKNFGKGGIWDMIDICPNKKETITAEFVEEEILDSWMPDPVQYADWAIERMNDHS